MHKPQDPRVARGDGEFRPRRGAAVQKGKEKLKDRPA
jgi:hypothetical protein